MGRRVAFPLVAIALCALLPTAGSVLASRKPAPRVPLTGTLPADWQTWWGRATLAADGVTLASSVPSSPAETHSALLTSRLTWTDPTIDFRTTTLTQLRAGSAPNPWEVGWVMFRFRDLENYYYFILKTDGFELGKKQGSDAQIFLATGELPALAVGTTRHVRVQVQGPRIRVAVDGTPVVDFTDAQPLTGAGSVGLYEEDSRVRFGGVAIQ